MTDAARRGSGSGRRLPALKLGVGALGLALAWGIIARWSNVPVAEVGLALALAGAGTLVYRGSLPFARDGQVPVVGWVVLATALLLHPLLAAVAAASGPVAAAL